MAATVMGSAVAMLTATVVNVALPVLGRELDANVADLQWVVNGYMLTLAALILLGGSLGDRYGRRRVYVVGVIWFGAASILCALAPSSGWLIGGRVLQGIGGAMLTPGSLAIIQSTIVRKDRSAAIGAWSGLTGIAAAVGPFVGGAIVDTAGWRWIFALPIPLVLMVIWSALRHVPESRDPTAEGALDIPGAGLAVLALGGISFPIIQIPETGWDSATIGAAILGALGLAAFILRERTAGHPMLPLGLFSSRQFTSANLITLSVYAALGGVFFLLVVHLQTVVGYSATLAGAAPMPITILMLVGSPGVGRLAQRIGPRIPLTAGPALLAAGMLMMGAIGPDTGYLTGILPSLVVFGVGLTLTVTPVTATVLAAADARHSGLASGVNNAVARTAQLLAVAALPTVAGLAGGDFHDADAFQAGFGTAMMAASALAAAGAVLGWTTIRENLLRSESGEIPPIR